MKYIKNIIYNFLDIKMANDYYQKHEERFRKEACERYQNPSEEEKEKKRPEKDITI